MKKPRIESILELLREELYRAHLYNGLAKAIRDEMQSDEFWRGQNLLMASYYAALREFILSLSKLLIPHQESVTIPFLVEYVEQNPKGFAGGGPIEVRKLCKAAKLTLKTLFPLRAKIKLLRDDELAHLDKRHIGDPNLVIPSPIEFKELDNVVQTLIQLLNDFGEFYNNFQMEFRDSYKEPHDELQRLFGRK